MLNLLVPVIDNTETSASEPSFLSMVGTFFDRAAAFSPQPKGFLDHIRSVSNVLQVTFPFKVRTVLHVMYHGSFGTVCVRIKRAKLK
jgi:hypothetical protein